MRIPRKNNRRGTFETKKEHSYRKGIRISLLLLILLLLLGGGILLWRSFSPFLPFQKVVIINPKSKHINSHEVTQMVNMHLQHGFFFENLKTLQSILLKQQPWIYQVSLCRVWPDTLVITLVEQIPLARWNKTSLINIHGALFFPPAASMPSDLPRLSGSRKHLSNMVKHLKIFQELLNSMGAHINRITLNQRNNWEVLLAIKGFNNQRKRGSEPVLRLFLGSKNMTERIRRFIVAFPELIKVHGHHVAYIDLRYPSGLAVKENRDHPIKNSPLR